jgi:Protein of unknown function (DUF3800)
MLAAYGIAISRRDWNQIVRGDMKRFLGGDAEGYAVTQCFVRTLQWAQENTFDPQISFVFDRRPSEIQRRAQATGDAFSRHTLIPSITDCSFGNSYEIRALQAADLVAWEIYQHANAIFRAGKIISPQRKQLQHLNNNMKIMTQYANRQSIWNIVKYIRREQSRDFLRSAANHFSYFDPSNPDHSHLSNPPLAASTVRPPRGRKSILRRDDSTPVCYLV